MSWAKAPRGTELRPGPGLYLAPNAEQRVGRGQRVGAHASHSFPPGLWRLSVHLSQGR